MYCVDEIVDSTGIGMYELVCKVCDKYNLNWRHSLIGQAYDAHMMVHLICKEL